MNQPLISVIVPVYNVEDYLEKCINSILNQSYKNIEIILIDDGSEDNSGSLCDKYERSCKNIKVIHKENEGLGFARNSGLDIMKGKYVTFIDSDDWVSCDLILNMYQALKDNRVEFCKGGFQRSTHAGDVVSITQYKKEIFEGNRAAKDMLPRMIGSSPDAHDSFEMCVCASLYCTNIIKTNNIRFPSERVLISEDMVFNIDYLQNSDGACSIDAVDYYYRMNEESLSHRYRTDRMEASEYFYNEMRGKLESMGYGSETILRLNRMFFIYVRMSIGQEKKSISGHDRNTSLGIIQKICENSTVKKTIEEYPVERLGTRQRMFLKLIKYKMSSILYIFANMGLM